MLQVTHKTYPFLGGPMKTPVLGPNVAVFILFFGLSVVDAIWSHNWLRALLWLGFGALFLRVDMKANEQ